LIITIVVVSAITMSLSYFNASRRAEAQLENKAGEYMISLRDILEIPLWNLDRETAESIGRAYAQNEFVAELRIIGSTTLNRGRPKRGAQGASQPQIRGNGGAKSPHFA